MSRQNKYIIGNWKMNGNRTMAAALIDATATVAAQAPEHVQVVMCPPTTLLSDVMHQMTGFNIRLGAQDCHWLAEGAHTGDISATMLKEAGCGYVIVGHSERRFGHGETSELVRRKAEAAIAAGLIPIICVGETLEERQAGHANQVIEKQLKDSIPTSHQSPATSHCLIAYEPIWAIGAGLSATSKDIEAMHAHILSCCNYSLGVLYGGSVKAANAAEILTISGVSGVLVGGASLKAEEFCRIIESTQSLESSG